MDAKEFFRNANPQDPKTCTAIVWLSPEYFTETASDNVEFKARFANAKYSYNQLVRHNFFFANDVESSIQRGKFDNEQERYRPYILFYNNPTKCYWAAPMSTSYDFKKNKNNPSFYELDTDVYLYLPTCVIKPERSVVLASRAIPVTHDMLNYKTINFPKLNLSTFDKFLKENFTENQLFAKLAYSPFSEHYTSHTGSKTLTSSAMYGFFLLNYLQQHTDIVDNICAKYTTTSSINALETFAKHYDNLCNQTLKLELALDSLIKARTGINECKRKQTTLNNEKLKSFLGCLNKNAKNIAIASLKIVSSLNGLQIDDISNFQMDMKFANDFCQNASSESELNKCFITEILTGTKAALSDHILKLKEKQKNETALKNEKLLKEQQAKEEKRRQQQAEKDRQLAKAMELENAKQQIINLKTQHYGSNFNLKMFLQNLESIDELAYDIQSSLEFWVSTHDGLTDNAFLNILNKLDPFSAEELGELKELLSSQNVENIKKFVPELLKLITTKTIRDKDLKPETIAFLNNKEKINNLINKVSTFNENVNFVRDMLNGSDSIQLYKKFYKPLQEKRIQLREISIENVRQLVDTFKIELTEELKAFEVSDLVNHLNQATSYNQIEGILKRALIKVDECNTKQNRISKQISKIKDLANDISELSEELKEKRKLSINELSAEMKKEMAMAFNNVENGEFTGTNHIDDNQPYPFAIETKIWHAILKYDIITCQPYLGADDLEIELKEQIEYMQNQLEQLDFAVDFKYYYTDFSRKVTKLGNTLAEHVFKITDNYVIQNNKLYSLVSGLTSNPTEIKAAFTKTLHLQLFQYLYGIFEGNLEQINYKKFTYKPDESEFDDEETTKWAELMMNNRPKFLTAIEKEGVMPRTPAQLISDLNLENLVRIITNGDKLENGILQNFMNGKLKPVSTKQSDELFILHDTYYNQKCFNMLINSYTNSANSKSTYKYINDISKKLNTDSVFLQFVLNNINSSITGKDRELMEFIILVELIRSIDKEVGEQEIERFYANIAKLYKNKENAQNYILKERSLLIESIEKVSGKSLKRMNPLKITTEKRRP